MRDGRWERIWELCILFTFSVNLKLFQKQSVNLKRINQSVKRFPPPISFYQYLRFACLCPVFLKFINYSALRCQGWDLHLTASDLTVFTNKCASLILHNSHSIQIQWCFLLHSVRNCPCWGSRTDLPGIQLLQMKTSSGEERPC